jgi:hypothetical protein
VEWLDRRLRLLRVAVSLLAAGLIIAIAGCAPPPDLDAKTGRELQSRVLAVTTAAATGDPATGLRTLDELVEHLTRAAANGDVSFRRHQSIMKAVEAVRASLRTAAAAEAAASKAAAEQAAAAKAAAPTAAAEKAAAAKASEAAAEASDQNVATNQATVTLAPNPPRHPSLPRNLQPANLRPGARTKAKARRMADAHMSRRPKHCQRAGISSGAGRSASPPSAGRAWRPGSHPRWPR